MIERIAIFSAGIGLVGFGLAVVVFGVSLVAWSFGVGR